MYKHFRFVPLRLVVAGLVLRPGCTAEHIHKYYLMYSMYVYTPLFIVGKSSHRWTHSAVVARVERPACLRAERAPLLGKRTPEEARRSREPNGDKVGKQRDLLCVLCSVVLVLYSYNLPYSNRDCPNSNPRHNVKNIISLISSKDPSTLSLIKAYTQGHNHSTFILFFSAGLSGADSSASAVGGWIEHWCRHARSV